METKYNQFIWLTNPEDYVHGDAATVWISDHSGMESSGWVLVEKRELVCSFSLPSKDEVLGKSVEQLKDMIAKIDAAAHTKKMELQQKINTLLAIGHDTTVEG
jgi:hypothetical protein